VIGRPDDVERLRSREREGDFFLAGLLIVVSFYHLMLWVMRRAQT